MSENGAPLLRHTTRWIPVSQSFSSAPDWLPADVHDELVIQIARASRG